ncbi:MAG: ribonuclease T2 family protein [Dongiaceae bacterium]
MPAQSRYTAIALSAAAFLAACDQSPSVDHYVLALSWQPAFCEFRQDRPECRALDSRDFAARHLALHGLWPNSGPNEGPTYCGVDSSVEALDRPQSWCELPEIDVGAETRAALAPAMPGTRSCLDRHEWIKHGTCAGIDVETYFAGMLDLAAAVHGTELGRLIAANIGRELPRQQLIDAFEAAFGRGAGQALTLICARGGDGTYLSEIRIALKPTALDGELDAEDLYLSGPQPAGFCPGIVRIDRVRQQRRPILRKPAASARNRLSLATIVEFAHAQ